MYFPTESVTFHLATFDGVDDLGNPKSVIRDVIVDDCLVAPKVTTDEDGAYRLTDTVSIVIEVPASFTDSVANGEVTARGTRYRVIGNPTYFHSPLQWNREIVAEVTE